MHSGPIGTATAAGLGTAPANRAEIVHRVADLSLALLQDSGWYDVKYGSSGFSSHGYGAGCDFALADRTGVLRDPAAAKYLCPPDLTSECFVDSCRVPLVRVPLTSDAPYAECLRNKPPRCTLCLTDYSGDGMCTNVALDNGFVFPKPVRPWTNWLAAHRRGGMVLVSWPLMQDAGTRGSSRAGSGLCTAGRQDRGRRVGAAVLDGLPPHARQSVPATARRRLAAALVRGDVVPGARHAARQRGAVRQRCALVLFDLLFASNRPKGDVPALDVSALVGSSLMRGSWSSSSAPVLRIQVPSQQGHICVQISSYAPRWVSCATTLALFCAAASSMTAAARATATRAAATASLAGAAPTARSASARANVKMCGAAPTAHIADCAFPSAAHDSDESTKLMAASTALERVCVTWTTLVSHSALLSTAFTVTASVTPAGQPVPCVRLLWRRRVR